MRCVVNVLPPGKAHYTMYRRLVRPKAGLEDAENPPGFGPRIVQSVASRCTD